MKFKYKKSLRLLISNQFNCVYKKNNRKVFSKILIFSKFNKLKFPRLGLSISKKNIKKSHERNRIKRLIRESFRIRQYILHYMDFVIIVQKDCEKLNNNYLFKILKQLWNFYI